MKTKTVIKSFSNIEMKEKITSLEPLLSQCNIIGYAAARNARALMDASTVYSEFERNAIIEYGTPDTDDAGKPIGTSSISPESDNYDEFLKAITPLREIQHEVPIMIINFEIVIGVLSGREILEIDWMLED